VDESSKNIPALLVMKLLNDVTINVNRNLSDNKFKIQSDKNGSKFRRLLSPIKNDYVVEILSVIAPMTVNYASASRHQQDAVLMILLCTENYVLLANYLKIWHRLQDLFHFALALCESANYLNGFEGFIDEATHEFVRPYDVVHRQRGALDVFLDLFLMEGSMEGSMDDSMEGLRMRDAMVVFDMAISVLHVKGGVFKDEIQLLRRNKPLESNDLPLQSSYTQYSSHLELYSL
jgi:hypothetical protein